MLLTVSRVSPDYYAVEEQSGGVAGEKDFVAVPGLTPTLDDDTCGTRILARCTGNSSKQFVFRVIFNKL